MWGLTKQGRYLCFFLSHLPIFALADSSIWSNFHFISKGVRPPPVSKAYFSCQIIHEASSGTPLSQVDPFIFRSSLTRLSPITCMHARLRHSHPTPLRARNNPWPGDKIGKMHTMSSGNKCYRKKKEYRGKYKCWDGSCSVKEGGHRRSLCKRS